MGLDGLDRYVIEYYSYQEIDIYYFAEAVPSFSRRCSNSRQLVRMMPSSWTVLRTSGSVMALRSSKRKLLELVMSGNSSVGREQWTMTMVIPG